MPPFSRHIFTLRLCDVADDRLSALIDRNVLHRDLLLAPGPISLQRFHLHRKRPRQLVECPFGAVLLEDVVHMGEAAGEGHGGHVNCRHLGSHHRTRAWSLG